MNSSSGSTSRQLGAFSKPKFGAYTFTRNDSKHNSSSSFKLAIGNAPVLTGNRSETGKENTSQPPTMDRSRGVLSDITNKKREAKDSSLGLSSVVDTPTPGKRKSNQSRCVPPAKRKTSVANSGALAKCNSVMKLQDVVEAARARPTSDINTPVPQCSRSTPSKLLSLRKKILDKVAGKPIVKQKAQVLSKEENRRLSMVLRSERELLERNLVMEEKLQNLQEQCSRKESELESVRNVGRMLGRLCVNQADELKSIKGAFPSTLREVAQLRLVCQKQEKELKDAHTVVPCLREQVKLLTSQLDTLAADIEKVKADRIARRPLSCGFPETQMHQHRTCVEDSVYSLTMDTKKLRLHG